MEQIRTLKQEELVESLRLSEFAFQYELSPEDMAERIGWTDPAQVWGYFVDEKLAAKLNILNFETWLHGKLFAMGGIAGVATWPEYRRQGMVGQLLVQALRAMKENGQTLSFLAPFSFAFYRKYGWETYVDYQKYEIQTDKLPRTHASEGSKIQRIALDWQVLNPLYQAYAKRFSGTMNRTEDWWNNRFFKFRKGTAAVYHNAEGEARGYIFYQVKEKVLTVHELVALDEDARRGLWKFIADHDSMIEKVLVSAPSDDSLPFLLSDPKFKQETITYFMARIVDVPAFMAQYAFQTKGNESIEPIYLKIMDKQAEWNDGLFRLQLNASGATECLKMHEFTGTVPSTSMISCDIQTLAVMMMGYKSATFLSRIGRLNGTEEEVSRLEAHLPVRTTYLMDHF
jgi:predicted acetyltransferase